MRTDLDPMGALPEPPPRRFTLVHRARPFTMNDERRWTHWTLRKAVEEWRDAFVMLARVERVPHLDACRVEVTHWYSRGRSPDVGACAPAAKAALDGVVLAGVLDDDDPSHVLGIDFRPPLVLPDAWRKPQVTGAMGLTLLEARA